MSDGNREALTFFLPDGGIVTVGQRAGMAVTQACQVVLIATELLRFGPEQMYNLVSHIFFVDHD